MLSNQNFSFGSEKDQIMSMLEGILYNANTVYPPQAIPEVVPANPVDE